MADWYKFVFGEAATSSTATSPVLGSTYSIATINPTTLTSQASDAGLISFTLSGAPRLSTTRTGREVISMNWEYMPLAMKTAVVDAYFKGTSKFIMIDDQRRIKEVLPVPGTLRLARRRATATERDSYSVSMDLIELATGSTISVSARDVL